MKNKGLTTTVQVAKTKGKKDIEYLKYTTPVPMSLIKLLHIEKGDKLVWDIKNKKLTIKVSKGRK